MAGTNNFLTFDENYSNIMDDSAYSASTYRANGCVSGIAPSNVHNKLYLQTSVMATALAQVFANHNINMSDASLTNLITSLSKGVCVNFWKPSTTYAVGDIAYSSELPNWARIECVVAGTTGTSVPTWGTTAGVLITDNGVTWIMDDIRDGTAIGRVIGDLGLRPGYIKPNGATVTRAAYPRLWKFATDNSLTTSDTTTYPGLFGVGDGSTTFVLPDWRGVVQRFLDESKGYDSSRVLGTYQSDAIRNITGYMQFRPTAGYGAGSGAIYAENLTNVYDVATSTTANALTQVNFDASRVVPTAAENRMKNIAELAVIRY